MKTFFVSSQRSSSKVVMQGPVLVLLSVASHGDMYD